MTRNLSGNLFGRLCGMTASVSSVVGLALIGPAHAAEAELEEIIVTARRVEERLQDVPISISVLNQEQLSSRNITTGTDLALYMPSLSSNDTYGQDNARFQIRGFVQELDTQPSVGVYFADVVAPRAGANSVPAGDGAGPGSFFDLQNVQVLKGPQGTLFGRNTTGGAILLVPQKPTDEFAGYAEATYGDYNLQRIEAAVNIPVSDALRVRLGVDRQVRDGWIRNRSGIGPSELNDIDYTAARLSVVADLTPNLENYLIASFSQSDTNGTSMKLIACDPNPADPRIRPFAALACGQLSRQPSGFYDVMQPQTNPHSETDRWQVINTTTWNINDNLTLKNIASYAEYQQSLFQDLFGTDFILSDINPQLAAFDAFHFTRNAIGSLRGGDLTHQSTLTEELQLQGRAFDGRLTWQAGVYYELSKPLSSAGTQGPTQLSCVDQGTLQCSDPLSIVFSAAAGRYVPVGSMGQIEARVRYRDMAAFSQATFEVTDTFKITAGVRYTDDEITNRSKQPQVQMLPPPGVGPNGVRTCLDFRAALPDCLVTFRTTSDAPTWVLDLVYAPSSNLMGYAKYARGYRAGSIAANVPEPSVNYIKPERVDVYELGMKSSFDGAIQGTFNTSVFYNDFINQQLQVSFLPRVQGVPNAASAINAGKSEIYGAEVETGLQLFEGFTLLGSYTYLKTEIKSVPDFSVAANNPTYNINVQFQVGDPLILSPENKYTITARYELPVNESLGKIALAASFTHSDEFLSNYNSRNSASANLRQYSVLDARDLVNLNFDWDSIAGSPVDLSLFVTNLTEEEYYTFTPGLALGLPFESAALGEPRMYGMRLKYRFGN